MEALESPIVTLSEAFLAQMSEIPHVTVPQGLNLGADATSRIKRGVVRRDLMPHRVSAEGTITCSHLIFLFLNLLLRTYVCMYVCVY